MIVSLKLSVKDRQYIPVTLRGAHEDVGRRAAAVAEVPFEDPLWL